MDRASWQPGTTAATDAALFVIAVGVALYLHRIGRREPWKRGLWTGAFGLAALTAALGAVMHGFALRPRFEDLLWDALTAAAGLAVGLLVVGMIHDRWGLGWSRRALPIVFVLAIGLFIVRLGARGSLLPFQLFVAAAALAALAGYAWMALRRRPPGALFVAVGILVSLIGVGVHLRQETTFSLIWTFDHNGIYHLTQMAGLLIMTAGLKEAFERHGTREEM